MGDRGANDELAFTSDGLKASSLSSEKCGQSAHLTLTFHFNRKSSVLYWWGLGHKLHCGKIWIENNSEKKSIEFYVQLVYVCAYNTGQQKWTATMGSV